MSEQENGRAVANPPEASSPPESPIPPQVEGEVTEEDPTVLRAELDAAHKRVDELARAYQALQQDREEFKRRLTRERERLVDVERGEVAKVLLGAIDELDRCLKASASERSPLAEGVRLIRQGLLSRAQESGIERLELVGQPFDPNLAEAVDMEVTPSKEEDGLVVAELQPGYRLKERIIRPARVKVARFVRPADA